MEPDFSRVAHQQLGVWGYWISRWEGVSQPGKKVVGVAAAPEPCNSVCRDFCPDLMGRTEPPEVRRVGLADLPKRGGTNQVHRKVRGMTATQSSH